MMSNAATKAHGLPYPMQQLQKMELEKKNLLRLYTIDQKVQHLIHNNPPGAFRMLHKVLKLKHEIYGHEDTETHETQLDLAEISNILAQSLLQQGLMTEADVYVGYCNRYTQNPFPNQDQDARRLYLRAQMFNILTCLSKAKGNVREALRHCARGFEIMLSLNSLDHLPTCYLNACALYSSIGLHAEALRHALLALQILQQRIQSLGAQEHTPVQSRLPLIDSKRTAARQETDASREPPSELHWMTLGAGETSAVDETASGPADLGAQLAVTYYNIAVQQEHLLDFPACIQTYRSAVHTATEFLGSKSLLTQRFRRTLKKALEQGTEWRGPTGDPLSPDQAAACGLGPTSMALVNSLLATGHRPQFTGPHMDTVPSLPLIFPTPLT